LAIDGNYWPQYDQNVITDPQANADAAFAIFQAQGYVLGLPLEAVLFWTI